MNRNGPSDPEMCCVPGCDHFVGRVGDTCYICANGRGDAGDVPLFGQVAMLRVALLNLTNASVAAGNLTPWPVYSAARAALAATAGDP